MKHVIIPPIKKVDITQAAVTNTSKVTTTVPTQITATIDKTKYIQIPQHSLVIALEETHRGKDIYDTLEDLLAQDLKIPTPEVFMTHWLNVREAAIKGGTLNYANGTPVPDKDVQDLWGYMALGDRDGCWTWLNASFDNPGSGWYITTNLEIKITLSGKKYLGGTQTLLDLPIKEDCYVKLNFNNQGMPTTKSPHQEYKQGKNIHFQIPRSGHVAGFFTGSSISNLSACAPDYKSPTLGVFACAQGETK